MYTIFRSHVTVTQLSVKEHQNILKQNMLFTIYRNADVIFLLSDYFRSAFRIPEARIPFLASEFWPNVFSSIVYSDCIIYKTLDVGIKDPCIFLEGLKETMKTLSHYASVVIRNEHLPNSSRALPLRWLARSSFRIPLGKYAKIITMCHSYSI